LDVGILLLSLLGIVLSNYRLIMNDELKRTLMATFQLHIMKSRVFHSHRDSRSFSFQKSDILNEGFRGFPQTHQANAGVVREFANHPTTQLYIVRATDSGVK
jgi:hypothetical protein